MTLSPEQFNRVVLREELVEVKEDIKELRSDNRRLFQVLDGIVKQLNDIKSDSAANLAAHDRFETRITHLEKNLL